MLRSRSCARRCLRWSARDRRGYRSPAAAAGDGTPSRAHSVVSALDPSFRAQELSFVVSQIAPTPRSPRRRRARSWVASAARAPAPRDSAGRALGPGARRRAPRAPLGLAAQQPPRRDRSGAGRARRRADVGSSTASGSCSARCRCCARTRSAPARTSCAALPGTVAGSSSAACSCADRHQHDRAVGAAAGRRPDRRPGAGGDLVRGRTGGVHADAADPVQPARAGRLEDRPGPGRGRRDRRAPSASRSACCSGLAARRRARPGAVARPTPTARATWPARSSTGWAAATLPRPERAAAERGARRPRRPLAAARRHIPRLPGRARRQADPARRGDGLVTGVAGACGLAADAVLDLWNARRARRPAIVRPRAPSSSRRRRAHDRLVPPLRRQPHRTEPVPEPLAPDQIADGRLVDGRRDLRTTTARHGHRCARDLDRRPPRRRPPAAGDARRAGAGTVVGCPTRKLEQLTERRVIDRLGVERLVGAPRTNRRGHVHRWFTVPEHAERSRRAGSGAGLSPAKKATRGWTQGVASIDEGTYREVDESRRRDLTSDDPPNLGGCRARPAGALRRAVYGRT
jgi:hypothetical protein